MATDTSAEPDQQRSLAASDSDIAASAPSSLPLHLEAVSGNHLTEVPVARAPEADKGELMHPTQDVSRTLQASMPSAAAAAPNFAPLLEPSVDVGHDLARDIQMASLATPAAGATHFSVNNQTS
ncbi:hypothetical protein FB639_003758, partial [Coemansia asiatica]